jgi:recombination protein RecT
MSTSAQSTVAKLRGQDIENLPPKQRVQAMLKANKNAIEQVLPRHVPPERLMQVAFSAVRTTPALLNCKSDSLIGAIIQCAQLGLEPNTVLGHCYLIPFKDSVQLIIGYKGLIDLARRSGQIVSIAAHCVHEGDTFEYEYGLEPKLRHIPAGEGIAGAMTHAYAVAHLKDGGNAFEVMTLGAINQVMLNTQSKGKYGPWREHFEEMARKTAIRRLSKYLPLSIEFASAVAIDNQAATGKEQNLDGVLSGEYNIIDEDNEALEDHSTATEALKDRLRTQDNPPVDPPTHNGAPVDTSGEVFDPQLHAVNEQDEPVYNKDGSFRKRAGKKAETEEPDQALI